MNKLATFDAFKHLHDAEGFHELSEQELRNLQAILLRMLDEVHSVCLENGIEYCLVAGSCLGAVRHKGIIPWDDDLDIGMTRDNFERFCQIFEAELGNRYYLHTPMDTPGYGLAFARIRDKQSVLVCRDDYFLQDEYGVYIDLFIWESVPDNALLRALHGFASLAIGFSYSCRRFADFGDMYGRLLKDNPSLARVFKIKTAIGRVFSFADVDRWTRLWYSWNSACKNHRSRFVTLPSGRKKYFGEMKERDLLFPSAIVPFGEGEALVPNNYNAYLTKTFGRDYMTPPPEKERERHIVVKFNPKMGDGEAQPVGDGGKRCTLY